MKGFFAAISILAAASGAVASNQHNKRIDHKGGQMSWFNLPKNNDKCGHTLTPGSAAVHVPKDMWRNGENCGQWMQITANGRTEYAMVTGQCTKCYGNNIDVTPDMFKSFGCDPSKGVQPVDNWKFMSRKFEPKDIEDCA